MRCAGAIAWALCALAACSSSASERCQDYRASVRECDLELRNDLCDTKGGRCAAACWARASCRELQQATDARFPAWLDECLYKCRETAECPDDGHVIARTWLCDGENDCVDGWDERGCEYFACKNHSLISLDDRCDEWPDCLDRSDELSCGYFLCHDNSRTAVRCDNNATCGDGSDEDDCP